MAGTVYQASMLALSGGHDLVRQGWPRKGSYRTERHDQAVGLVISVQGDEGSTSTRQNLADAVFGIRGTDPLHCVPGTEREIFRHLLIMRRRSSVVDA